MRTNYRLLLFPLLLIAAPARAAAETAASDWNPTRFMLLFIAMVLVFANALLAYVLRQLATAMLLKKQRERDSRTGILGSVLLAGLLLAGGTGAVAQTGSADAGPLKTAGAALISGIPAAEFWFLSALIAFLMICMIVLIFLVRMMSRGLRDVPIRTSSIFFFRKNMLDSLNKSIAIQEESTILLDHDYDGIRELDNDLPPWWKWGFVATIISGCMYMGYYHVWGGPGQVQEYETAVRRAEVEQAKYLATAGEQVDETNVALVLDAGALNEAKALFNNVCAACHRPDGGGSVGPNLTDEYWLHGGALQDVFKSIKYGWRDKGMPPWNGNLSARQIAGIASFVKGLKGSKPAGAKPPQGTLFVEDNDKSPDSLSHASEPSLRASGAMEHTSSTAGAYRNKADGKGAGTLAGRIN